MDPLALRWHFFVDESGNFDDLTTVVAVTGILIPAYFSEVESYYIREQLQALVPEMPWPLHTCVIRTISWLPLTRLAMRIKALERLIYEHGSSLRSVLRSLEKNKSPNPTLIQSLERILWTIGGSRPPLSISFVDYIKKHRKAIVAHLNQKKGKRKKLNPLLWTGSEWQDEFPFDQAIKLLLTQARTTALACARMIASGEEPKWASLKQMDAALLANPGCSLALEHLRDKVIRGIKQVMSHLSRYGVMIMCSSESYFGDFAPPGDGKDRYLSLLEALLVRLIEILERTGRNHIVKIAVATRNVLDQDLAVLRELHVVRDLCRLCRQVVQQVQPKLVKLIAYATPRYSRSSHPGYVLADFGANCCRGAIQHNIASTWHNALIALEHDIYTRTGLYPRSGNPSRTHLQAGGTASSILQKLRTGAVQLEHLQAPPNIWKWAFQQACEWAQP